MPLHIIKLAVGCESVKELKSWVAERIRTAKAKGLPRHHIHITRMTPKRVDEVLDGGSLYWVIRGEIAAREKLIAIEPFRDKDGIGRCRLVMQPKVIAVMPRQTLLLGGSDALGDPALQLFDRLTADGKLDDMKRHYSSCEFRFQRARR